MYRNVSLRSVLPCLPMKLWTDTIAIQKNKHSSFMLLISRQGKVRLAKWFTTMSSKSKSKIVKDVTQLVLARRTRMCNFLEYKGTLSSSASSSVVLGLIIDSACVMDLLDSKVVYRRYASLFFVTGIGQNDNELITLEIIHRSVQSLMRIRRHHLYAMDAKATLLTLILLQIR